MIDMSRHLPTILQTAVILGGEVIIPVEASAFCGGEALDGEVQPFICIFLVDNWQAPLSGSTV